MNRCSKIIATIGPASESKPILRQLVLAGMDVARLNVSHGDHEGHKGVIRNLREISTELDKPVGILMDLQGPKIRTGEVAGDLPLQLKPGMELVLSNRPLPTTSDRVVVNYPHLTRDLHQGDRILLDDGRVELQAIETLPEEVRARVVVGGSLNSNKGVHFPGVQLSISLLSEKDRSDLAFGISQGVDAIAMSFVRNAADMQELKQAVHECCPTCAHLPLIAKLERPEAIENLDEILEEADGVMVARGDLGIEVSPERVPSIQKDIIQRANERRRIVITATQMLETMILNPRPTRAEASDVANAVFDGSDALMLSGETAIGSYPIECVHTMDRIIRDAEVHHTQWGLRFERPAFLTDDDAIATTHAAKELAHDRSVEAIAVFTRSGRTALLMSKTRPHVPILAFTPDKDTYQQLSLYWGVEPHLVPMSATVEEMIKHVEDALVLKDNLRAGHQVVVIASLPLGAMGPANFSLLHTIRR